MSGDFSDRLKELRAALGLSQRAMAEKIGGNFRTWQSYESGTSVPGGKALRLLTDIGVNGDWLLTGEGPMMRGQLAEAASPASVKLDAELMARIVDGIKAAYKDEHVGLPDTDLGRLTAHMYDDLSELYDDPADRMAGMRAMLLQLRRSLQAPVTAGNDGSSKRQA